MVLWKISICNSWPPKPALRVTDRDIRNRLSKTSQSVTSRRQNRLLLLQIEMFEAVSLQAELGTLVAALEACRVEPHHAKVRAARFQNDPKGPDARTPTVPTPNVYVSCLLYTSPSPRD